MIMEIAGSSFQISYTLNTIFRYNSLFGDFFGDLDKVISSIRDFDYESAKPILFAIMYSMVRNEDMDFLMFFKNFYSKMTAEMYSEVVKIILSKKEVLLTKTI